MQNNMQNTPYNMICCIMLLCPGLNLEEDHHSQGGKDILPLGQTIQILPKNDAIQNCTICTICSICNIIQNMQNMHLSHYYAKYAKYAINGVINDWIYQIDMLLPKMSRRYVGARHIYSTNEQQKSLLAAEKIEIYDRTLS